MNGHQFYGGSCPAENRSSGMCAAANTIEKQDCESTSDACTQRGGARTSLCGYWVRNETREAGGAKSVMAKLFQLLHA